MNRNKEVGFEKSERVKQYAQQVKKIKWKARKRKRVGGREMERK